MSRSNIRKSASRHHLAPPSRRRRAPIMLLMAAVIVAVAVAAVLWSRGRKAAPVQAAPAKTESATRTTTTKASAQTDFARLLGKWVRPDGGYVVEIRYIGNDGKMQATYFNPRPINVARAEASVDGTTLKVFIELRDVNYPGSTYTLRYDPQRDALEGLYFQAALQESFDVTFFRMN